MTINAAIVGNEHTVVIPYHGESVVAESNQQALPLRPVPTLFVGRWTFRGSFRERADISDPLKRTEHRITAGAAWDFVQKAQNKSLPIPDGLIDWLTATEAGSAVVYETTKYKLSVDIMEK